MKKAQKQSGTMRSIATTFLVLVVMLAFLFAACGDKDTADPTGPGGPTSPSTVYTGTDSAGNTYKLVITEAASKAAYNPQTGDSYELTVNPGNKRSVGTVVSADGGFELKPAGAAADETFTVMVDGGVMIAIAGEIKLVDSTFTEVFVSFIPQTGAPINGDTIADGVDVVYDPANLEAANKNKTFIYILSLKNDGPEGPIAGRPPRGDIINEALTNDATIEVVNGKATIIVPKPKAFTLFKDIFPDTLIYIPEGAKNTVGFFGTEGDPVIFGDYMEEEDYGEGTGYYATNNTIGLACARDNTHLAGMTYLTEDVIVKGAVLQTDGSIMIFDLVAKEGWNFIFYTYTGANNQNVLITASTSLPSSYKWTIIDHTYFE